MVVGVDGRRGGWAVAVVEGTPERAALRGWETFTAQDAAPLVALARAHGAAAVGIDVPVGLPRADWRPADLLAKRALGRAHPRVFLVPPREVLTAHDYAAARTRCRAVLHGKGLSAQTWGLRGPVLAVDALLAADPWARGHVVETHPELSFAALAGQVLASKKTAAGRAARIAALARWLDPDQASEDAPGEDHLDAAACAYSALRWAAGGAVVLGGDEDERGLPMRVVT
ncbi:putative RNase H-like nuclease [Kineococcus rhizosphaerae]|uniref:Putative RNase H-like nuclease n=1 Tax=Kineococcus rhizosphaerae TaxID=559628 RepID=A0A2T0R7F5_9ACTN|nr:putative RNase H-like nuclease [Kineococcus rhizosphaerae]